jgi:hypothetical protein
MSSFRKVCWLGKPSYFRRGLFRALLLPYGTRLAKWLIHQGTSSTPSAEESGDHPDNNPPLSNDGNRATDEQCHKQDDYLASEDGGNFQALKALLQTFLETKLPEQYLKNQQT